MSAGTFTLNPGPPTPGTEAGSFAGTQIGGIIAGPGVTAVTALVGDLAATIKEAPVIIVQLAYMRACREFCRRSRWLKRNITNTALTVNQPIYNFGVDPNLEVIGVSAAAVQQQNTTWVNLRPADQGTFDPNMKADLPNWYSYLDEGMVRFYPTPNYAYLSNVNLVVQTAIGTTNVPNDLVNKFNLYLEEGAKAYLYAMQKEDWYSPDESAKAKLAFEEGWGIAKSWVDKGYQQGSQRATPRPFLSR